ncbi:hypothetical protein MNV49_001534 [Pseudohyphozyma bogoriensis]|nr:hypothetical protein MNV49_001534 [Pseudohyphozyma bogoriensis]
MATDLEKTSQTGTEEGQSHSPARSVDARVDLSDPEVLALDKATVKRLDWTVLPICALFYFLSFLDRSNIGNAKTAGLATDLRLTSHQYLVCVTCTYVLYIVFEFPSNMLLFPLVRTGLVKSYAGLVVLRLVLGALEGGLFPGLVLYLSGFYRRRELQTRVSLFFSAASLSGAFSGLVSAGIIKMQGVGGQAGWRWIFYLEGIVTVLIGAVTFFLLPASAATSRFLTAEQRAHCARRLILDVPVGAVAEIDDAFSWAEVRRACTSPQVILLGIALFGNGTTLYSFAYFTPTIVATFKYSTVNTQLLTVPPFVFSFLSHYGTAARYVSLFLTLAGTYGLAPALITWLPNNSAGHYRKATAVAIGFVCTNSGGIASTWLFPATAAPKYKTATAVNIGMCLVSGVFALLNLLYLIRANKQKAFRRANEKSQQQDSVERWYVEGDKHEDFVYSY